MEYKSPVELRFWKYVRKTRGCWYWIGAKNPGRKGGYGRFNDGNRLVGAHRMAWALHYGPVPYGLEVCHRCDKRDCVRPDHLFVGTHKENHMDASRKGRRSGTLNPNAKLTIPIVREIRRLRGTAVTLKVLGIRYGVTLEAIRRICKGDFWKMPRSGNSPDTLSKIDLRGKR